MRRRKWVMVWALTAALTCSACGKDAEELAEQKGLKTLEKAPEIVSEKEPDSSGEKQETAETKETMEKSVSDTTESGGGKENAAVISEGTAESGTVQSGKEVWYTWTTQSGGTYQISITNQTANGGELQASLFDGEGTELKYTNVAGDGQSSSIAGTQLEGNTSYYVRLNPRSSETLDYTVLVENMSSSGTVSMATEEESDQREAVQGEELVPGSNQENSILLPLGTEAFGTYQPGSYSWFAFTTGEKEGATYKVTMVNETIGSELIEGVIYDEFGECLSFVGDWDEAGWGGVPTTFTSNKLKTNTTYYICLSAEGEQPIDYSIIVKDPDSESTAYKTAGNFTEARGPVAAEDGTLVPGTNQNNAAMLPMGAKVSGSHNPGMYDWFSFTTGEVEGTTYYLSLMNKTVDSAGLEGSVYDEYGDRITFVGDWEPAYSSGKPSTFNTDKLQPDTTYYVQLSSEGEQAIEYSLALKSSEPEAPKQNTLVFEKPFEINETQVQFVINKAEFIDEEKAKKVLKPVAEAILANPDHAILIAGTTATDGTQESCVDLSLRRTEAVKKLLTETYQVPESQIQVVGLGYENDPFERGKDRDANGNFVESEGKKNRRVVILDVDDPIAQELLKNNK